MITFRYLSPADYIRQSFSDASFGCPLVRGGFDNSSLLKNLGKRLFEDIEVGRHDGEIGLAVLYALGGDALE